MTEAAEREKPIAAGKPRHFGGSATFGRMARLALKELRETLRDRRTILTLVLMPLLVYPLLSLTFQKFLRTSLPASGGVDHLIAVESEGAKEVVDAYLTLGQQFLAEQRKREREFAEGSKPNKRKSPTKSVDAPPVLAVADSSVAGFRVEVVEDLDAAVAEDEYDLGIRIPPGTPLKAALKLTERVSLELIHRRGSRRSRDALTAAERSLDTLNNERRVRELEQRGFPRHKVPAQLSRREVKATGTAAPYSLAALIPLILILMTITGAVYPAIDLTAGERERGTLEMLIAAPVPRIGLLLAKYSAVLLVAVMTATVNLVGMTLTLVATGLGSLLFGSEGLSAFTVAAVFGLMLLFAAFFSAVVLVLTSFARSFKEAQAYLIPLMLVSIAPGILSVIPGVNLDGMLLVTPLANIVLLARDLLQGQADPVAAVVVVLSTFFFAGAALSVAAKIFGTDAILYGSHGSWSDLFRRPKPSSAATVSAATMTLAFMFPGFILLGQFVMRIDQFWERELSLSDRLVLNGFVSILLFGVVPLLIALNRRVEMREGFALKPPRRVFFPAAILLGVSLFPFVFEIVMWTTEWLGSQPVSPTAAKAASELAEKLRGVSLFVILISLAIIPAVCEEFFFRGFLLSAFRRTAPARTAIFTSAILFGVFHIVVRAGLAPERLLPSALMGVVLGWVCVRSGSLYPGMILHACHNGLLLMIAYYQRELIELEILTNEQSHIPLPWLAGAAAIAATGFGLAWFGGRVTKSDPAPE